MCYKSIWERLITQRSNRVYEGLMQRKEEQKPRSGEWREPQKWKRNIFS